MIVIHYKKLFYGMLIGPSLVFGMSSGASGLTALESEILQYEPVRPGARIQVIAKYGEWADLDTSDLELLQSRPLTYVANRLLLPEPEKDDISTRPFELPIPHLEPLWALLLKPNVRSMTFDLAHESVRLADYLCLHKPEVLSRVYNRAEEGQLSRFLKELARSNMPVLCEYYERLLKAGQQAGGRELERFIVPYITTFIHSRLGQVCDRHRWMRSLALSTDGDTLVSSSDDRTVIVRYKDAAGRWQMGQQLGEINNEDPARGHTWYVRSLALSTDGDTLVSGSWDRTIIIWRKDAAGRWQMGQRLGEVDNTDPARGHILFVSSVALSTDGETLVSGSWDYTIIIWHKDAAGRWQMGQQLGEIYNRDPARGHTNWVRSVALSPDGNTLVSGSDDHTVIIWRKDAAGRWQMGQQLGEVDNTDPARGHTSFVNALALSTDGDTLVSGSDDHTVIIWRKDAAGRWQMSQQLGEIDNEDSARGHTSGVSSLALSTDGDTLVSGSDDHTGIVWRKDAADRWQMSQRPNNLRIINFRAGRQTEGAFSLALSADGNTLVRGFGCGLVTIEHKDVGEYCRSQRLPLPAVFALSDIPEFKKLQRPIAPLEILTWWGRLRALMRR